MLKLFIWELGHPKKTVHYLWYGHLLISRPYMIQLAYRVRKMFALKFNQNCISYDVLFDMDLIMNEQV